MKHHRVQAKTMEKQHLIQITKKTIKSLMQTQIMEMLIIMVKAMEMQTMEIHQTTEITMAIQQTMVKQTMVTPITEMQQTTEQMAMTEMEMQ